MKIRTKVILYTSALVFVVAATIAFGVIRSLKANLLDEFEKDSIQTHSLIAASLVDPLYNLHIGQLQSISRNARIHPNILEIIVLDDSGYILSDGSEENDLLDEEFTNTFSQKVYEEKKTLSELTEKQLQVGSPVYLNNTDLKGYLFITYDISEIKETINESTQSIIELSLACLLVGIILSLFLSQQLISPIKRLARIAADIGCGNLQVQVKHESGELGILSKTLEEMAQSLQASMVSKDSLHSIIDNIPEMIFVLDNDFHITKINSVTQLKLDIPAAQIIGLSIQVIIPGLPLDSKAQQNTDSTITFNGKKIAILFSSTKIASMGYVCAAVDIALQKETEGALKTAIEVANLANNAKSSFLANMSHEIRTPLNAMIGYTDLLLEDELSGEQREMIKVVKQSSDSLLVLINDILDISKIEAGELILESAPVNLIDCIFEICEIQRAKMYNKNLDLNIDTTKLEHPFVYADKTRIKQVFLNLVSNAIKFTSEGEIIIRAEPVEESEHKIDISFTVADTGIGMSFEQSKHIFDAFKQADSSTTRKYGGTGLGLNITKNIIELMKSDITVNSQQVHGCTFSFTIQFKKDLRAQAPKTEFKDNMADGKTVFIIEKTPTAEQTLLYQMLEIRAA
ncbi:MAG: HAMP domain-containing protein, partial [Lentisphaeraceae bacterium]|nr:HAMP domain-containing protein [Lentisphaeraceae bacterium]